MKSLSYYIRSIVNEDVHVQEIRELVEQLKMASKENAKPVLDDIIRQHNIPLEKIQQGDVSTIELSNGNDPEDEKARLKAEKEVKKLFKSNQGSLAYLTDPSGEIIKVGLGGYWDNDKVWLKTDSYTYRCWSKYKTGVREKVRFLLTYDDPNKRYYSTPPAPEAYKVVLVNTPSSIIQDREELQTSRKKALNGVVYNDPWYYRTLANENIERYRKIITQNRANRTQGKYFDLAKSAGPIYKRVAGLSELITDDFEKLPEVTYITKLLSSITSNISEMLHDSKSARDRGYSFSATSAEKNYNTVKTQLENLDECLKKLGL